MAKQSFTPQTVREIERRGWVGMKADQQKFVRWHDKRTGMTRQTLLSVDMGGMFDRLAIRVVEGGIAGIQVTSLANVAARRRKINDSQYLIPWLRSGSPCLVWGWHKVGNRWQVREWQATLGAGWEVTWTETGNEVAKGKRNGRRARNTKVA